MYAPQARFGLTVPRSAAWEAMIQRGLLAALEAFLVGVRAAYFLLMWLVTAYEAAMIVGTPIVFHLAQMRTLRHEVGDAMYLSASLGHVYLLPAVAWFLVYQGLPSLAKRRAR